MFPRRRDGNETRNQNVIMVYSEDSKAYRVYNFRTKEVAVNRDVIFLNKGQATLREEDSTQEVPFEMVVQNEMEVAEEQVVDGEENDLQAQ